ncbi:MAG: HAMP domain-containing histidine kinase [Prevotellaceae bacterium]|jgi:two-component system OmpR family sensor kinase/two-component system phosphate regulon sensor histidine kinase PhoR|nr:HAMP domain-containing histidine kinase [Prevotellaceae bacterium]
MKLPYTLGLTFVCAVIFAIFVAGIIVIEQRQERHNRRAALEARLDGYVNIIDKEIENQSDSAQFKLNNLLQLLPAQLRITVIDNAGTVVFDSEIEDLLLLGNHSGRSEILQARYQPFGSDIRLSASTGSEFLYYAKHFSNFYIRAALPYDTEVKSLLRSSNSFIYITLLLFILVLLMVWAVANRFSKSLASLRTFSASLRQGNAPDSKTTFPYDELGEIGRELVAIFQQKEQKKQEAETARENLIRHFQTSYTGIGIFNAAREKIFVNTHFIMYVNQLVRQPTVNINQIFEEFTFAKIADFIENDNSENRLWENKIEKNGKIYLIKVLKFSDKSFEITIDDITETAKTATLKQEMTSNIAHELRTPVTSIRAYLETLQQRKLTPAKQELFIENACNQAVRLSELIDDVTLLAKIGEAGETFRFKPLNVSRLINNLCIDLHEQLTENQIALKVDISPDLTVYGNYTLLFSVFQNLAGNSIKYAGKGVEIGISNCLNDSEFVYFTYYDTGTGIDEQHFERIFERFYRIDRGRTRAVGGSGLGLSIVKNVIQLHGGSICAKTHASGGLEFIFSIRKGKIVVSG